MEKNKKEKQQKSTIKGIFATFKGEFGKIIWPSRMDLLRNTGTVIFTSLLFGVIIFGMDSILGSAYQMILLALD